MANLKLTTSVLVFSDQVETAQPRLRGADWLRGITVPGVSAPRNDSYVVAPGEELAIFNGTRTLTVDGTTTFSLDLAPAETINYRLRRTAGAAAGFRTARTFSANGGTVAIVVNANQTITMTIAGGNFTGIVAGDTLWLPGTEEGVTSPFSVVNRGFWKVMTAAAGQLVLRRAGDFDGEAQAGISITNANQMAAFSAAGVQVGDSVELISGFAAVNRGTFPVVAVTSSYIDFQSTIALAAETGVVPTAAGLAIYTNAKRWLRIEADQAVAVKVNGDTGTQHKIEPWVAGDVNNVGEYSRSGPTWGLSVLNLSTQAVNLTVISVE